MARGWAATGVTMLVLAGQAPAFAVCIRKPRRIPASAETAGVLNSITAGDSAHSVADALKWLATGSLEPRLTTLDVWNGGVRRSPCRAAIRSVRPADCASSPIWMATPLPISLCGRKRCPDSRTFRPP